MSSPSQTTSNCSFQLDLSPPSSIVKHKSPAQSASKRQSLFMQQSKAHAMSDSVLKDMKEFVLKNKAVVSDMPPLRPTLSTKYAHLHGKSTRRLNVTGLPSSAASKYTAQSPVQRFQPKDVKDPLLENTASYQKLLRKLAPSVTNSATTYLNLLHLLQACRICGGRVTFCETCEKSATEYFTKFSIAELEKSYGRQLPPPDAHAVMEFEKELKLREQAIKEKL
ncbi:hypothetical protein Ae201684_008083 [Aphanomyces euteiches]|uniref:Uncharacterized protein n=1 Tax=Aphanomyces euteiches TaxID=100861 RepID=A0A6G0X5Y9_9STRA|nr:hypothetical protein Ae201684_008083 [Aphanomyces euteiches]KAH9156002.1 hypothetical protein AeRB84_002066 [Aphanomyces euteiches]